MNAAARPESIADGASYSSALEHLLPQILDRGREHDELHNWTFSRVTIRHEQIGVYVVTWSALTGDRQIVQRGPNVGSALRKLLDEMCRRIAVCVAEAG